MDDQTSKLFRAITLAKENKHSEAKQLADEVKLFETTGGNLSETAKALQRDLAKLMKYYECRNCGENWNVVLGDKCPNGCMYSKPGEGSSTPVVLMSI